MGSLAFVFPGQGSQKVGMGKDLLEQFSVTRDIFETASQVLGRDIAKICFEGPAEELMLTSNAQPAIFVVSAAILEVLKVHGVRPTYVAGHSLGEITAYYSAGVINLEMALRIIDARGSGMAAAVPAGASGMAAVMGMDLETLNSILDEYRHRPVVAANLNCPGQIVISGERAALDEAIIKLKAHGAKVIPLPVSGAFHSPMMQPGADSLAEFVKPLSFENAQIPVILNRTAQPETRQDALKANLPIQVVSPVRWIETVRHLADTVDSVVEIGPGKVLTGLIKKIAPDLSVCALNDRDSLTGWLDALNTPKEGI
jgi:[acyl-carrier-protein] S-malonyltransferase